mgnify:FL=1
MNIDIKDLQLIDENHIFISLTIATMNCRLSH